MSEDSWFYDIPVIGSLSDDEIEHRFNEADLSVEQEDDVYLGTGQNWPLSLQKQIPIWKHTTHVYGYLSPDSSQASGNNMVDIVDASAIAADTSLKGKRIKITLDRLRIASYPGRGTHHILFDFYAQNQLEKGIEHLHFNAIFRARAGEQAPLSGCPIFIGLKVGEQGVIFKFYTINVRNEEDEKLIQFLEGDLFRSGLQILSTVHPAVALISQVSYNLTRHLASRGRNVPVQDVCLGLDFSHLATRSRLAEGTYLVVQLPPEAITTWSWSEWKYNRSSGVISHSEDRFESLKYNYMVFGVSRM